MFAIRHRVGRKGSVMRGVASVLDVCPATSPRDRLLWADPLERDALAIRGDMERVAEDMWKAIGTVADEQHAGKSRNEGIIARKTAHHR